MRRGSTRLHRAASVVYCHGTTHSLAMLKAHNAQISRGCTGEERVPLACQKKELPSRTHMGWSDKDWDRIAAELDDGAESDDGDSLNVVSVQRNAQRVAELVRTLRPDVKPDNVDVAPPMGMNSPALMRGALAKAMNDVSRHLHATPPSTRRASEREAASGREAALEALVAPEPVGGAEPVGATPRVAVGQCSGASGRVGGS